MHSTLRASLVYAVGMLAQQLVGAFLLPVYTRWLGTTDFGVFEILSRTRDVFLLTAGSAVAITTIAFFQLARNSNERKRVVFAAIILQTALAILLALTPVLFAKQLASSFLGGADKADLLVMMLGVFFFDALHLVPLAYWQARMHAGMFVSFQAAIPVLRAVLIVLLFATSNLGLRGVLLAWVANSGIFALVMTLLLLRDLRPWPGLPSPSRLLEMVRYGWPFIPNSVLGFVISSGDRYFLASLQGSAAVGIYGLGYRLAVLAWGGIFIPFQKVWSASMIRLAQTAEGRAQLVLVGETFLGIHALLLFCFLLLGPEILSLLAPPSYAGAWSVVPILVGAQYCQTLVSLLDSSLYASKRTKLKATITASGAVLILILYVITIPRWGITGAAWATLFGYLFLAIVTDQISNRVLPLAFRRSLLYGQPLLGGTIYASCWMTWEIGGFLPWSVKSGALVLYLGSTLAAGWIRIDTTVLLVKELVFSKGNDTISSAGPT